MRNNGRSCGRRSSLAALAVAALPLSPGPVGDPPRLHVKGWTPDHSLADLQGKSWCSSGSTQLPVSNRPRGRRR